MATKSHLNPYEYDSRMIDWNLKNKFITKDKLKNFMDALPDDSANSELIEIQDDDTVTVVTTNGVDHHTNGV